MKLNSLATQVTQYNILSKKKNFILCNYHVHKSILLINLKTYSPFCDRPLINTRWLRAKNKISLRYRNQYCNISKLFRLLLFMSVQHKTFTRVVNYTDFFCTNWTTVVSLGSTLRDKITGEICEDKFVLVIKLSYSINIYVSTFVL